MNAIIDDNFFTGLINKNNFFFQKPFGILQLNNKTEFGTLERQLMRILCQSHLLYINIYIYVL